MFISYLGHIRKLVAKLLIANVHQSLAADYLRATEARGCVGVLR